MTRVIVEVAEPLGIQAHDHINVGLNVETLRDPRQRDQATYASVETPATIGVTRG